MDNIGLYLVDLEDGLKICITCGKKYHETWAQYNKHISRFEDILKSQINKNGFITAFGHVSRRYQDGTSRVEYELYIDDFKTSYLRTEPPPSKYQPDTYVNIPFDEKYDIEMGKCKGSWDFKYNTWLHVTRIKSIPPVWWENFTRYDPYDRTLNRTLNTGDLRYGIFPVYCTHKVDISRYYREETAPTTYEREYEKPLKEY